MLYSRAPVQSLIFIESIGNCDNYSASPQWGRVVTILARRVTMQEAERGDPEFLRRALHELQQGPAA